MSYIVLDLSIIGIWSILYYLTVEGARAAQ